MDPTLLPSLAWSVHIARHRSFTKAAAEMGVSRAAPSQSLKTLEQRQAVSALLPLRPVARADAGEGAGLMDFLVEKREALSAPAGH